MKTHSSRYLIVLAIYGGLIGLLFGGCAPPPPVANEPGITLPADVNQSLTLRHDPLGTPPIAVGAAVALRVINHTNKSIWYALDYGARIFWFEKTTQSWIEVDDKFEFTPLDPEKPYVVVEPDFHDGTVIYPDLIDNGEAVTIRVYIFGKFYENGAPTAHEVAAYTEIVLPSLVK